MLVVCLLVLIGGHHAAEPQGFGPLPTPAQLSWQAMEYNAFIHFNMNTFTDSEWGSGREDPAMFNPTSLDCRQWARILKKAGMAGVIITAKHHDGFCLWPSRFTDHTVRNSPFRGGHGDVLKELSDACREFGLKFGVYLSPWDRHEPSYGDSPRYNEHFKNQLREVLTSYGEVFEVWFDGACGEGPNGKRQEYDWTGFFRVVRECQPDAVIFSDGGPDVRWVGDEDGYAGETNWSLLRRGEVYPGYPNYRELITGHSDGNSWVPAECDVSIRPGWYYHASQDEKVKDPNSLAAIYFASVGRNATLLLNVPVDRRGLISANDSAALINFGEYRRNAFGQDLLRGAHASADNVRGSDASFAAGNTIDGRSDSYWTTDDTVRSASVEYDLSKPASFNCFMVQEYIPLGQRVESFSIQAWRGGAWDSIASGTTIGHKRLLQFPEVRSVKVRLNIVRSRACPLISNVALFKIPGSDE